MSDLFIRLIIHLRLYNYTSLRHIRPQMNDDLEQDQVEGQVRGQNRKCDGDEGKEVNKTNKESVR